MTTLSERQQAIMFVDTAEAYRQQGDIEAACGAALNALKIGTDTTSSLLFRRLQTLSSHLEPWKTSEPVKQLAQQIAMKSVSTEH